jgi:hypothetical protein
VTRGRRAFLSLLAAALLLGSVFGLVVTLNAAEPAQGTPKLEIKVHTREEIMTCAYKVYGDDQQGMWAAKTIIRNTGEVPARDFRIAYKIEGYTDWTSTEVYPIILPGQTVRDYCWPNLDDAKVKEITTKTPVELKVRYEYDGLDSPVEDTEKIYLLGKNDFTFTSLDEDDIFTFSDAYDNYPLLAAFVTPNEETVKSFANRISGGLETVLSDQDALAAFIRCFEIMRQAGIKYIMEPSGFWTERQAQYVQYPHETLLRASGTCLDLAICMAALMEAVGIRSYVALIPGHAIPVIQLPQSGRPFAIEATFIDRDYALSHYPGQTGPEVTAQECMDMAEMEIYDAISDGSYILIDIEKSWENGVMPIW